MRSRDASIGRARTTGSAAEPLEEQLEKVKRRTESRVLILRRLWLAHFGAAVVGVALKKTDLAIATGVIASLALVGTGMARRALKQTIRDSRTKRKRAA